jgi:integrase
VATIRKLRGRWQAQVRRRGTAPRAKSFNSRSDAERWGRALEAQVDRCGALPDTRLAEQTTLKQILTRYRDEISPTKRSAQSEQLRIDAIIRRPICHRTLALLTSADLAKYRDERLKVVAPATVIRELNTIGHAIDTARREWGVHLVENPARMVKRPTAPNGRTRRLSDNEEQDLLEAAERGRCRYMRPLITLALETGARRGELLGLRWADIDLDRRIAHLPLTKNGSARDIPLSSRATETLRALAARRDSDTDHVFPISGNAVRLAWERLRQRAGIVDLHFHDLRHEAVSRLFEKGLDMMAVAAISGHKTLSMLSRYTHLRAVDLVERLG